MDPAPGFPGNAPAPAPAPPTAPSAHDRWCAWPCCTRTGTISKNTRGVGPWYCAPHFLEVDDD